MFAANQLEEHEKACNFREIQCPDSNCDKEVLFKDLIDHVDTDHKDWNNKVMKVNGKTFIVTFDEEANAIKTTLYAVI